MTREDMERIAVAMQCTLNNRWKQQRIEIWLRCQGVVTYLGQQHLLEALSEEAFQAKIVETLAKSEQ